MITFVNLSTTHDYSIHETIGAFAQLCNQHNNACLRMMPGLFQNLTNYAWVMYQYKTNSPTLIEPYKLGKMTTDDFLKKFSTIFYFMSDMDESERHQLLSAAWSSSIKLSPVTKDRFGMLVDQSLQEPVYLISNTNALDARTILDLFQTNYPDLPWKENIDISVTYSKEPVEILPNVFMCLSFRYGITKTNGIIEHLSETCRQPITLVSNYSGDLEKGKALDFDKICNAEEFYNLDTSASLLKKNQ